MAVRGPRPPFPGLSGAGTARPFTRRGLLPLSPRVFPRCVAVFALASPLHGPAVPRASSVSLPAPPPALLPLHHSRCSLPLETGPSFTLPSYPCCSRCAHVRGHPQRPGWLWVGQSNVVPPSKAHSRCGAHGHPHAKLALFACTALCMLHAACPVCPAVLPLPCEDPCCLAMPYHCESLCAAGTTTHPETLSRALFSPQLVTCQDGRAGGLL